MVDKDVVLEKINRIQNCLQRIYKTVASDISRLEHYDEQDIVTLNLQRAIQLTIDLAAHVVRARSLGMPQTLKENFQLLYQNQLIDSSLKEKMESMVGFRNVAVHDYESINPEILKRVVTHHLKDLEEFYTAILNLVK
jgi:uncharacterized protein YutE (UPF0331/DUF86 family)